MDNWLARALGFGPRNSLIDGRPEYQGGPGVERLSPGFMPSPLNPREAALQVLAQYQGHAPAPPGGMAMVRGLADGAAMVREPGLLPRWARRYATAEALDSMAGNKQ